MDLNELQKLSKRANADSRNKLLKDIIECNPDILLQELLTELDEGAVSKAKTGLHSYTITETLLRADKLNSFFYKNKIEYVGWLYPYLIKNGIIVRNINFNSLHNHLYDFMSSFVNVMKSYIPKNSGVELELLYNTPLILSGDNYIYFGVEATLSW